MVSKIDLSVVKAATFSYGFTCTSLYKVTFEKLRSNLGTPFFLKFADLG